MYTFSTSNKSLSNGNLVQPCTPPTQGICRNNISLLRMHVRLWHGHAIPLPLDTHIWGGLPSHVRLLPLWHMVHLDPSGVLLAHEQGVVALAPQPPLGVHASRVGVALPAQDDVGVEAGVEVCGIGWGRADGVGAALGSDVGRQGVVGAGLVDPLVLGRCFQCLGLVGVDVDLQIAVEAIRLVILPFKAGTAD